MPASSAAEANYVWVTRIWQMVELVPFLSSFTISLKRAFNGRIRTVLYYDAKMKVNRSLSSI